MTTKQLLFATRDDLYTHLDGAWGDLSEEDQQSICDQLIHEAWCDGVVLSGAALHDPKEDTHDWSKWMAKVDVDRALKWLTDDLTYAITD